MDEPFSAGRPGGARAAAVGVLRLQETVRKTIVFVTHDIEEAVRIGDRIAGHEPRRPRRGSTRRLRVCSGSRRNPFVRRLVGSDGALKRLAVTGIGVADLEHPR
jgi:osmoprotectant transport system ATP-binding protein